MTTAAPFTPEVALAMATDYIKRNEQWLPPIGIPMDGFIVGKSTAIVFCIRQFDDVDVFGAAFIERVNRVKSNLRDGLVKSGWAESHKEAGFQFIVYPCDDHGANAFADATWTCIAMEARFFAKESQ